MKNIILNLTPAMQATTGGIDPQRQIELEVAAALKGDQGEPGQPGGDGGGRKAFRPGAGAVISSVGSYDPGAGIFGPPEASVERIAPFTPAFDFFADRIGVFVHFAEATEAGYDDRIVIYESDADGRPTGAPALSVIVDVTQAGLRDAQISFSFKKDKLYWVGTRTFYTCYAYTNAALGVSISEGVVELFWSLRRPVDVDDAGDYPTYSNDLLSTRTPTPVLIRIAE